MTRRYCGRVGAAFDFPDGERCPECGYDQHQAVSTCFRFVDCDGCEEKNRDHGHPCLREPGHAGRCEWWDTTHAKEK